MSKPAAHREANYLSSIHHHGSWAIWLCPTDIFKNSTTVSFEADPLHFLGVTGDLDFTFWVTTSRPIL